MRVLSYCNHKHTLHYMSERMSLFADMVSTSGKLAQSENYGLSLPVWCHGDTAGSQRLHVCQLVMNGNFETGTLAWLEYIYNYQRYGMNQWPRKCCFARPEPWQNIRLSILSNARSRVLPWLWTSKTALSRPLGIGRST